MNRIIKEDICEIFSTFDMKVFSGRTVLVTGATGLLGKFCVWSLLKNPATLVVALVRNREKAERMFGKPQNLQICVQDITVPLNFDTKVDYVIHGASITSSKDFVDRPVETIDTALLGTRNVLNFAKEHKIRSMVYLSSLEVYGVQAKENISEEDMGYIDILSTRSSYSLGKRMAENMCIAYSTEYGVPVKIARLAQTFGAGIDRNDNRVFAQFARSVINKTDIVLHTRGETKRNYCYITDAVRAIFTILTAGNNNEAYNVANENTYCSIAEIARKLSNENTCVLFEIDEAEHGYAPTVKIKLLTAKLEKLGWQAKHNLADMFERLINSLKESEE